jgi:hypothetical protein
LGSHISLNARGPTISVGGIAKKQQQSRCAVVVYWNCQWDESQFGWHNNIPHGGWSQIFNCLYQCVCHVVIVHWQIEGWS